MSSLDPPLQPLSEQRAGLNHWSGLQASICVPHTCHVSLRGAMPNVVGQTRGQNPVQVPGLLRSTLPCAVRGEVLATCRTGTLSDPAFLAHSYYKRDTYPYTSEAIFSISPGWVWSQMPKSDTKESGRDQPDPGVCRLRAHASGCFAQNWRSRTTRFGLTSSATHCDKVYTHGP